MPYRQVNQGVNGGAEDQDPVMASPISRPEPYLKPLDKEEKKKRMAATH